MRRKERHKKNVESTRKERVRARRDKGRTTCGGLGEKGKVNTGRKRHGGGRGLRVGTKGGKGDERGNKRKEGRKRESGRGRM